MADQPGAESQPFRGLTAPLAVLVGAVVVAAWVVTWASSDLMMASLGVSMVPPGPVDLLLFFSLLVVMMVAMMLPAALPMILAFRGLTTLEAGRPARPADDAATALFVLPYFLVWGAFAIIAVLGLPVLGLTGAMAGGMPGPIAYVPALTLVLAGAWQATRTKAVCLTHCQSPMGFVMHHWRSGRTGAFRMGMRHASYCIGCCWLFMLVLFVAGATSLVWMGVLSITIFAEKIGVHPTLVPRIIGVLLVGLGVVLGVATFVAM